MHSTFYILAGSSTPVKGVVSPCFALRLTLLSADIKMDNIQLTLPADQSNAILSNLIDLQTLAKENDDGYLVYASVAMSYKDKLQPPILCDLGSAVIGSEGHTGLIQPLAYRAPEVILKLGWTSSVDV
jgi:serine/threonine-protein kinase SRPK3